MEKETDLATGTFVEKWPSWLRWVLFIPSAIIGSLLTVIVIGILNWISMAWIGATENGLWWQVFQLAQSFMLGLLFVLFGATVIPKGQFATSIVLMIVGTIFWVLVFLASQSTSTQSFWLQTLHYILMIAGGGYAVYLVHKGEPLGQ